MTPDQVPSALPPQIHVEEYAPFSTLLRYASALVHHGGIGTLSQAFAAGMPQLMMPMAHDQPDNAERVRKMGAGLWLRPRHFTPDHVTAALHRLLNDPSFQAVSEHCAARLGKMADRDALILWIKSAHAAGNNADHLSAL